MADQKSGWFVRFCQAVRRRSTPDRILNVRREQLVHTIDARITRRTR
jgi:hypothetical protein